MFETKDGVAVITGGGGLLGRAMATQFAQAGMDVVLADRDLAAAARVAEAVEALGRRAVPVQTDVSDPAALEALAEASYAEFGRVNLLCNNAGGSIHKPFEELTLDIWRTVLGGNLMGVIHGIHAFMPRMIAQGDGAGPRHIVNTSSMSGVGLASLRHLNAPYVTAKFAVVGLTETMRPVLANHGIGVSVLCPGWAVAEPRTRYESFPLPSAEWYRDNILGAEDVAREVLHGVAEDRLYIFPHRAGLGEVEGRHEGLLEGFRQASATAAPLRKYTS